MTHYVFAEKKHHGASAESERWEALAAFLTLAALIALAGITYNALTKSTIYREVQKNGQLTRFAGILSATPGLQQELQDTSRYFTIFAPTNAAFRRMEIRFSSDINPDADKRVIHVNETPYVLQSEAFVVRSLIKESDVPVGESLNLPAANGDRITLTRELDAGQMVLRANGVLVQERIDADNGVVYIVDSLIHPLFTEASPVNEERMR